LLDAFFQLNAIHALGNLHDSESKIQIAARFVHSYASRLARPPEPAKQSLAAKPFGVRETSSDAISSLRQASGGPNASGVKWRMPKESDPEKRQPVHAKRQNDQALSAKLVGAVCTGRQANAKRVDINKELLSRPNQPAIITTSSPAAAAAAY
jgi:hypothetical protein